MHMHLYIQNCIRIQNIECINTNPTCQVLNDLISSTSKTKPAGKLPVLLNFQLTLKEKERSAGGIEKRKYLANTNIGALEIESFSFYTWSRRNQILPAEMNWPPEITVS